MKKNITTILLTICLIFIFSIFSSALSLGDIDCNGSVNAADARLALRFSAKLEPPKTEEQKLNADLNFDNKITAADARIILRVSAKLESIPSSPSINTERTMSDLTKNDIDSIIKLAQINCKENYDNIELAITPLQLVKNTHTTHLKNRAKYVSEYNTIYNSYNDTYQAGQDYIDGIDSYVEELKIEYKRRAESAGQRAYQNVMASGGTGSSSSKKNAAEKAYNTAYQTEYNKVNTILNNVYDAANIKIDEYNSKLKGMAAQLDTIKTEINSLDYYIEKCEKEITRLEQIINENLNLILDYIRIVLEEDYDIIDVPVSNQELYEKFIEINE